MKTYIAIVGAVGLAMVAALAWGTNWGASDLAEASLFIPLVIIAGSFPFEIAPNTKTDVTTAVLFGAVLLLEPAMAVVVGVVGIVSCTFLIRFWGDRLRIPWYKYPFNSGATAIYVGISALVLHAIAPSGELLTPAVALAAAMMYVINTVLVTAVVSLQIGAHPLKFWWEGTRQTGLAELSLLAFGFLGAVGYQQSPWAGVAIIVPVAIIYVAFSRLARMNRTLEDTLNKMQALGISKLASVGAISLEMAHHIRNPLAVLIGRLEVLQDRLEVGTREWQQAKIALDAGWRVQEVAHNLITIGQQKWVPMDMVEVVNNAYVMARLDAPKKVELELHHDSMPMVEGNPVLLREALSNVFSSAVESCSEGSLIKVDAGYDGEWVNIAIGNQSRTIPEGELSSLFEPGPTCGSRKGGLGLFVAKHIVEMHKGIVTVESREGEGTTVRMKLPALVPLSAENLADSSDILLGVR